MSYDEEQISYLMHKALYASAERMRTGDPAEQLAYEQSLVDQLIHAELN